MAGTYFDFSNTPIENDIILKAKWCGCDEPPDDFTQPAEFVLEVLESGGLNIYNKWATTILVDNSQVTSGGNSYRAKSVGDLVTIKERNPGDFRGWKNMASPLASGVKVKVVSMPKINRFTTDEAGTIAPDYFFYALNQEGAISEFPTGALDTSKITTFGTMAFRYFNRQNTTLASLPNGSFNFGAATEVGAYFCQNFNREATLLTSLPNGSFNFPQLVSCGGNMFASFNLTGSLAELPASSFQFPKLTTVGGGFGYYFNGGGKIAALPKDSFDMSAVTTTSGTMFEAFNGVDGQLGLIARDNTNYTPTVNKTSSAITAYYYPSGMESVAPGGQFHWKMSTT